MSATKNIISELVSRVVDETSDPADLLDVDKLVQTAVRKFKERAKKEMNARLSEAFEESLKSAMDALAPKIDEYRASVAEQTAAEFTRLIAERKQTEDLVSDIAAEVVKRLESPSAPKEELELDTRFTTYERANYHWGPTKSWTVVGRRKAVAISSDLLSFSFGKGSFLYVEQSHCDLFIAGKSGLNGIYSRSGFFVNLYPPACCGIDGSNEKVESIDLYP